MRFATLLAFVCLSLGVNAPRMAAEDPIGGQIERGIAYRVKTADKYADERCRLDLYLPQHESAESPASVPVIVWFHGGGLRGGERGIPRALQGRGIAVAAPSYRLHPQVQSPTYIEDAAAAVAWLTNHADDYGIDRSAVFVSGHSAGGYLAAMIGFDKKWLAAHSADANDLAGIIPFSGHTITHFTIREERGLSSTQPIVDEFAPLFHVRQDAPPTLLITGDRDLELLGRYEENAYFLRMLQEVEHQHCELYELEGYGHSMTEPAFPLLLKFVDSVLALRRAGATTE